MTGTPQSQHMGRWGSEALLVQISLFKVHGTPPTWLYSMGMVAHPAQIALRGEGLICSQSLASPTSGALSPSSLPPPAPVQPPDLVLSHRHRVHRDGPPSSLWAPWGSLGK